MFVARAVKGFSTLDSAITAREGGRRSRNEREGLPEVRGPCRTARSARRKTFSKYGERIRFGARAPARLHPLQASARIALSSG